MRGAYNDMVSFEKARDLTKDVQVPVQEAAAESFSVIGFPLLVSYLLWPIAVEFFGLHTERKYP
jgi:hypothetical protein